MKTCFLLKAAATAFLLCCCFLCPCPCSGQQPEAPPQLRDHDAQQQHPAAENLPKPEAQVSSREDAATVNNQPPPFALPQQQQDRDRDRDRDRQNFIGSSQNNNPFQLPSPFDPNRDRDRTTTDRTTTFNPFGRPRQDTDRDRDQFGRPRQDLDQFGRPRQDVDQFGRPRQDLDQFGRPRQDLDQTVRPRQDLDQFGRPRQDLDQFGRPRQDLDQFGRPRQQDVDQFGRPRQDLDQFGRPRQDLDPFGRPRFDQTPSTTTTTTTTTTTRAPLQPIRPFAPPFTTTTTSTTTFRPPFVFPGQTTTNASTTTTRRPTPFSPFGRPQFPVDPFGSFNRPPISPFSPNDPFGVYNRPQSSNPLYNPAVGPGIPGYGVGAGGYTDRGRTYREPRYFIVASNMVRPGQIYRVIVTVYQTQLQPNEIEVRASLLHNGVDIGSDMKLCQQNVPETLMILVPKTSVEGHYRLRVEGNDNGLVGGTAFVNETDVRFSLRAMTIFIQTDKPVYMQGQTVRFRIIPINRHLKAFEDAIDVYMIDPKENINRRWLSRQSNFGAVSLNYTLSDQPTYGNWTIRVQALNQIEEKRFWVEEYYQPRFEVNVTMPAFYFSTDEYLTGTVVANFTSGGPVTGNLTLTATVKPIDLRYYAQVGISYYETPIVQVIEPYFNGAYEFRFPMAEIERSINILDNMEVTITAAIGEHFWNEVIEGYSKARIYNSTLRLQFLGGSPQVFKPAMTFNCYLSISYQDGSPLYLYRLWKSQMEIQAEVEMIGGVRRRLEPRYEVRMLQDSPGIWKVSFNLKQELSAGAGRGRQTLDLINGVHSLRVQALFTNPYRESATAELLVVAHFSPRNRHLRIASSTVMPKVGEYVVFHVRGNFYFDRFTYVIMSKGVILLSGSEIMDTTIKTFAISVSPEMAPAATIVVYHVSKYMDVVADSLTFPVDGLSRNNFTVVLNNKKEKTNNIVEVIIRGEPGAYVGLSGVDAAFYSMQAGNEVSYGEVLSQMINFDEDSNGTLIQKWLSREGLPDEVVYFPQHSLGIDANRTFTYTGLVVFSDIEIPRKPEYCNETAGQFACYTQNQCYHIDKKCDMFRDCLDGTDESDCPWYNATDLLEFKLYRFSRMQRLYDNVWLWKDVNIGPHGHFIFSLPVPERPAMWMVSSLGVSPTAGFGLLRSPLRYSGVRPLFINVEMPKKCRQGEQIGIRVTVFNYMMKDIEVRVILADSSDYKFIHVGPDGIVPHYNPLTSFGEHQHLVWIRAQDTVQVHFPIVATKLGDVEVTIHAVTLIARDKSVNILRVDPDGVPQFRHTALLLDLSNRAYVLQFMHINVTESPEIPYETERYYVYSSNLAEISVVGDVVGPAYPTMPVNATSLLYKPMESAENNIFSFAANLYTLMYLRLTNQRDRVIYREAFHNLNVLYQRQLSFQTEDGAFSLYRSDWNHSNPSVWTTAFCARVLAEANFNEWENFLYIDPQVIARAVDWVIKFQTLEGSFYEVSEYANRKINDTIVDERWSYAPNITLTAHVLIALHVVRDLPGAVGPRLAFARQRAINYLESKVDDMKYNSPRPYDTALIAYALMLSKSPKADSAFIVLSGQAHFEGGYAYWGRERVPLPDYKLENNKPFLLPRLPYNYDSENIETTAYALMVYVARQEIRVESIVKWLNTQRLYDGGWASTQDTAASMRALIDYTIRQKIRNVTEIRVTVESVAIPGIAHTFHVTPENLARPQSIHIENAFGTVNVEAKGAGYAILNMKVQYGVDRPRFITQPPIRAFDLEVIGYSSGRNSSYIEYRACQSWVLQTESERSGMAVLEVNIPTGYFIHQPKLDEYVLSFMVPTLKRAKYLTDKVVFYFDYLEINPTCINFTVERWFPVANMTRYLPMRVYEYYAPERFNETLFDSLDTYVLDICRVCGSYQCPYCPIFASGPRLAVASLTTVISIAMLLSFVFTQNTLWKT